jgi:transposase
MNKEFSMSRIKERDIMQAANRFEVLLKVENGSLTNKECGQLLGLSRRQIIRLKKRLAESGLKNLILGKRGPKKGLVSEKERALIVQLKEEKYADYNLLHFRDQLKRYHKITRSYEFIRKLLIDCKLHKIKKSRVAKRKHRQRFEACEAGLLVQRDTSIHLWVPSMGKHLKLILDLDDHSRKIVGSYFSEHDDVLSNMLVSWETISTHGLPTSYYMDNNPIYNPIRHQQSKPKHYSFYRYRHIDQDTKETLPQFKRALKELGIECIHSTPYQPQGKGKVERIFRFMQDRLVNEMATTKVKDIKGANKALEKWVNWYNHNHVHRITQMIPNERYLLKNSFRELKPGIELEKIFSLKYTRKVECDNTISFEGKTYQIKAKAYRISYVRAQVEVSITMNNKLQIYYKNRCIGDYPYKRKENKELHKGVT